MSRAPGGATMSLVRACSLLSLSLVSVACSSSSEPSAAPPPAETEIKDAEPSCSDGAAACEGDAVCKDGACVEPTSAQRAQADELASMLGYIEGHTAWHSPIDWASLETEGRRAIFRGDGGEEDYFAALFHAFIAVPQGHQGLYLTSGCGTKVPMTGFAQRGACGRPHPRGVIVTHVRAGNPLGLSKGDLVVRVGDVSGRAVLDELADRPVCATSRPGASFKDASTAATFADLVRAGETLEIESPDGTRRTVMVPALGSASPFGGLSCADPLGRDTSVPVESYVRPDGVAVIRLPGFTDPEQTFPTSGSVADYEAYKAAFEAKIQTAFDAVKDAPAIVWDVRGNGGGLTMVALGIASGFPGAQADNLSYCQSRIPDTKPAAFTPANAAFYALAPGGPFTYSGKVAVLTDGMNYSAADYFPLAVKTRTSALLVGAATAGAFGATTDSKAFAGPPGFTVAIDHYRCSLASDGTPLEGRGVEPHVLVDYEPKDLAAGRDTVLERAVAELSR